MIENFSKEELNNEQWKAIDGYNGLYEVSSLGRVRSLKYGKVKVMKQRKGGTDYWKINLSKNGKKKCFYVHRLVAQAFIPNYDESKIYINHIDECKQNNRLWNLEYCTAQYNNTYNDLHHRRNNPNYKRHKLKDLYDPNLTYRQNLEIFRANGIECSIDTILRVRRDFDLVQHQPKRSKVKDLYDPNLTYKQNVELFRANGIECSTMVVKSIRRDLGLINP